MIIIRLHYITLNDYEMKFAINSLVKKFSNAN